MAGESATLSGAVYQRLRQDILDGVLAPGEKLRIELISDRYGATSTPVREALNQLTMEGFVQRREQRGFYVAGATEQELRELTDTRCWVEPIALAQSIAHRDTAWEEALVLAFHRMLRIPRSLREDAFVENPDWEPAHRGFHQALIAACPSRWLVDFCLRLSDHAVRYRRLAMSSAFPRRDIAVEHRALMEAALAGRAEEATELLVEHYRRTVGYIMEARKAGKDST
jgi:DNA-binding GntR family transcriptional regulator